MTDPVPIAERWQIDEDLLADNPREMNAQPRWITDGLAEQYGPDAQPQPTIDDVEPAEEPKTEGR